MKYTTREDWLVAAIAKLDETFFSPAGHELPEKLQVSCGFAKGSHKAIGQCWGPALSANETTQMFICPSQDEPVGVIDTLLHEMIHACVGVKAGHRGPFRKMVLEFGMVGPIKSAHAEEGSECHAKLVAIAETLGAYPHARLRKAPGAVRHPHIWLRFVSVTEEKYTITISEKNAKEYGIPVDPWGDEMVPAPKRKKG